MTAILCERTYPALHVSGLAPTAISDMNLINGIRLQSSTPARHHDIRRTGVIHFTGTAVQIDDQWVDLAKCVIVKVHLMEISKRSGDISMPLPGRNSGARTTYINVNNTYSYDRFCKTPW